MKTLLDTYSKYQKLPISEIMDYNRYNELLMIHSSSVMEGSTLTLDETEILIQEGIAPKGKPLSHSLMIKDHFDALQFVINKSKLINIKMTSDFLKEIGARVMYGTGGVYNSALGNIDSRKGDFRVSASRAAGGSYYVNHSKINPMINDLCNTINQTIDKISSLTDVLSLSSYAHLQLLTIHPFADGNGRSSRLLQNYIMLRKGFPLVIIRKEQKEDYISSIKTSRLKDKPDPFIQFISNEYQHHLEAEIKKYKDMQKGKSRGLTFILNL